MWIARTKLYSLACSPCVLCRRKMFLHLAREETKVEKMRERISKKPGRCYQVRIRQRTLNTYPKCEKMRQKIYKKPPDVYLLQHAVPRPKKRQTNTTIILRRDRRDIAHHLPSSNIKLSSFSSVLPAHDLEPPLGYFRSLWESKDENEPGVMRETMSDIRADIFRKRALRQE